MWSSTLRSKNEAGGDLAVITLENGGYTRVAYEEDLIAVLRNPAYAEPRGILTAKPVTVTNRTGFFCIIRTEAGAAYRIIAAAMVS